MKLQFLFRNETKGALRYQEVDESGRPKEGDKDGALVGTLYLRKAAMVDSGVPVRVRKPKAIVMELAFGDDDVD